MSKNKRKMIEGTTKDQYARQTAPPAKNHRHHLTKMGTQNAITWDSQGKWARKCALSSAVRINFRSECWKIARVMANLYRKKEPQTLLLLSTISELNAGLLVRYWAKRCSQNGEKTLLGHCIWCFERPFCSAFWKKMLQTDAAAAPKWSLNRSLHTSPLSSWNQTGVRSWFYAEVFWMSKCTAERPADCCSDSVCGTLNRRTGSFLGK